MTKLPLGARPRRGAARSKMIDAIAAGGGLAGAAFALELVRRGARAMVVERTSGPHHKVCGEFLSDRAQKLLRYLGVDPQSLGASSVRTLRLASGARAAASRLPFQAMGLSRFCLDEALLDAARSAGVEMVRSSMVEGLGDKNGRTVVRTTHGDFECRAAALASGKHNIRGLSRPDGPMVGFKIHVLPSPEAERALSGVVQLIAFSGGYVGFCLVEGGVLSIAWNIRREVLQTSGADWRAQSKLLAEQSSLFGDLASGAKPLWSKPLAVSGQPQGFMRAQSIAPSIYPVGDQLAVLPTFAGDGTALALASGIAAARAVLDGEPAPDFQRRILREYSPQFRWAMAIDKVIKNPLLCRAGITVGRAAPSLLTMLVAATRSHGADGLAIAARD